MPRKLKTYQTSLGFYDLAIAAPSMKAALDAWGAGSNLFHQGVARESGDAEVVAATMSKPGVVLRRPVGSAGPFVGRPRHLVLRFRKGLLWSELGSITSQVRWQVGMLSERTI